MKLFRGFIASLALAAVWACQPSSQNSGTAPAQAAPTQVPVVGEQQGKVEYAYRYYWDPEVARVSFASPMWDGGCSANVIGPRLVLTAAHCGPAESNGRQTRTLTFTVYRTDEKTVSDQTYSCRRLIHGWPRHDLALLYCDPDANGLGPGDKYGYLDVETRAPVVGDRVYSIWWNPVGPGRMFPLYSAGRVVKTDEKIWGGLLGGPANTPVGIHMDLWTQAGSSGSSSMDVNTHRILVGPTSTGPAQEGTGRNAFSMRTYLDSELLAPGDYPNGVGSLQNVTAGNFPAGSFDVNAFVGAVDKNHDSVLDVQENIELAFGESPRTAYWLGFENRRRNRLWDTGISATVHFSIDYDARTFQFETQGPELALSHQRLNLKPNTSYRVGVKVRTTSAPDAAALSIGFERPGQGQWSSARLLTRAGTDIMRTALIKTDGNPNPHLTLRTTAAFKGAVSEIHLIEDGAKHTFELADDRQGWTVLLGATTHGPAGFLPAGSTASASRPDFALVVRKALGTVNPVQTDRLLFLTDRSQRLCFMVKAIADTTSAGEVRIASGGSQVLRRTFPLTTSWAAHCFDGIRTPFTNTTLTFAGADGAPTYLVDQLGVSLETNVIVGRGGAPDPTPDR